MSLIKNHVFNLSYCICMHFTYLFSLHIAGLTMHATILACMFSLVEQDQIKAPLFNPAIVQTTNNTEYVHSYVSELLKQAFSHLQE